MLGTLRLTWTVRASDGMVDFLFQSNASGWFGFGIGSNMVNADIYFATKSSNGSLTVIDSWSSSSGAPQPDTSVGGQNSIQRIQDVTSLYPTSRQSVQFSRALTTSDSRDADIPNGPIRLIFAFHPSSHDYRYHESNRGVVDVNLYAKGVSLSASGSPMVPMSLKILHGFSMFLAFAVIYPVGIFVARYYTDLNKWVELHATLMATATSDVLITALTAIIGSYSDSDHLHVRLGIIIVGLVFTTMFTGYVASKITVKFLQPYITYIRLLHRILGFGTYAFGLVTGYFGAVAIQYGDETKWWIAKAYIGLVGFMPILCSFMESFIKGRGWEVLRIRICKRLWRVMIRMKSYRFLCGRM
ncbi:DOMON domain-containing protein [Chytridium lagenaria]|nr:DOMON domain-containing protein [Chytridium lagenaria]